MKNDAEYFVWHAGNKYILARTESSAVAQAVAEGLLNSEIAVHFPDSPAGSPEALAAKYQSYDVFNFKIVAAQDPDPGILRMINLGRHRAEYMLKLELMINKYHLRYFGSYDTAFYAWLGPSIARSTPESVDILIEEYAIIQGIDAVSAYWDLKMRWDSYALVKVKAWSFFEKFKRQINDCYTPDEMNETLQRCKYELFTSAAI